MASEKPTTPTKKQLGYMKKLGYDGEKPTTIKQASMIIAVLVDGGSPKEAEKIMKKYKTPNKSGNCGKGCLIVLIIIIVIWYLMN